MDKAKAEAKPTDTDELSTICEDLVEIPERCIGHPESGWIIAECTDAMKQLDNGCPCKCTAVAQSEQQHERAPNKTPHENNTSVSNAQVVVTSPRHTTRPCPHGFKADSASSNLGRQMEKCRPIHLSGDTRRPIHLSGDTADCETPNLSTDQCQDYPEYVRHFQHSKKGYIATHAKTTGQIKYSCSGTDFEKKGETTNNDLYTDNMKNGDRSYFSIATQYEEATHADDNCRDDLHRDQKRPVLQQGRTVQRSMCVLCGFSAFSKSALKMHMKAHEGEVRPFNCCFCNFVAFTASDIEVHSRQHVQAAVAFTCEKCSFKAKSLCRLDAHMRHRHAEGRLKCSSCPFSTETERGLNIHIHRKHFKEDPEDLDKEKNDDITEHLQKHGKTGLLQCPACDYITKWKRNLTQHVTGVHNIKKVSYKCPDCDQTFQRASELRLHSMRKHTGEKPFKCPQCDYATVVSSHLERHILRHTGDRPFMCEKCGYTAATKCLLTNHRRTHSGEKPYKCELCEYSASRRHHLQGHMMKHASVKPDRPFKCEFCGYAAVRKFHLERHMSRHTGDKPFKCSMCEYSTVDNSRLQAHIRAHTGEKPFQCSACTFATARKDHLTQHMRRRHKQKDLE